MLRADVGVVQRLCLFVRQRQDFFHPRSVGDVSSGFLRRAGADFLFDLHPNCVELKPHAL